MHRSSATTGQAGTTAGKSSPPSGKPPCVVTRGITQPQTRSPAGDLSHGFPAPRHPVAGPDHLVFRAEDKSVRSRRPVRAVSARSLAQVIRRPGLRLANKVRIGFTLGVRRGPVTGVEFKGVSAGEQRQDTKREVHHGFSPATAMPRRSGNAGPRSFACEDTDNGKCPLFANRVRSRDSGH